MPQYGIIVCSPAPADPMALTPAYVASLDRYPAQVAELGGSIVTGFAFQPSTTAKAIRGESVTDGTVLGPDLVAAGYYVLEAPDIETALRMAALNPATRNGGVEVHPLFVPPTQGG
jgi:hypothetical protein